MTTLWGSPMEVHTDATQLEKSFESRQGDLEKICEEKTPGIPKHHSTSLLAEKWPFYGHTVSFFSHVNSNIYQTTPYLSLKVGVFFLPTCDHFVIYNL